ncbi:GNAT family N-acetyltransferase [Vibrio parahaemolyticus]|uniref:GNAT family N-acetyltransferase n=1 Tax=Vibrio parahaemolyticus TaxID=670 RepID=UPI00215D13E0|nr:GNAT family N-acetyltransferase [Vibrio parahaemolyticus]MCR9730554.1 GNAT family N-acetyltransferase [Vibrio parahaemolyticus]MCR9753204.1 GNAT family N-acetyltransferase [Vibrio parahaemolyticus]MCR9787222.1 GNAT family N-acetyltransferase [Vibrio parahaemolyticus]MCZ6417792.1 GNAT family N-acetyltransferase [Vibrio parahaemolyticus]MCZ6422760.1 GNAT family N-acetyltransferase [Vibrio parahaemolyticus]
MIISNKLEPGDLGHIVKQHGLLYSKEYGYDVTFEAYVAEPLAQFAKRNSKRERIWLARLNGELVGTICICEHSSTEAQLRWFSVDPKVRGKGLGKTLIEKALNFCIVENYSKVILWTVAGLAASKSLYIKNGFQLIHEEKCKLWGQDQLEQCYEKYL